MIEVRQARYFLAVAQTLHFGRAAEQLSMSQPPLSQAILQLERQLGVTLFDRSGRAVTLTETGRAFATECRTLVTAAQRAREVATQAEAGPDDVVVVSTGGRTDVSSWGGIVSIGAAARSVRGVVTDGACRDVAQARELGFPVFARAQVPATARGRLRQRSTGEAIRFGGLEVRPGDVVLADEDGLVVVPRGRATEVLVEARGLADREAAIEVEVRAGVPLPQAMRDARLAGADAQ